MLSRYEIQQYPFKTKTIIARWVTLKTLTFLRFFEEAFVTVKISQLKTVISSIYFRWDTH